MAEIVKNGPYNNPKQTFTKAPNSLVGPKPFDTPNTFRTTWSANASIDK